MREGNAFTGVCLNGGGDTPWPLVPGSFKVGERGVPLVLSLVLSKVLFQVMPGGDTPLGTG